MPTAILYNIRSEKDGANVKVTYDLRVPVGGPALIASFSLAVDGKELIDQTHWVPGQVQFNGTHFTQLQHPENDVTVAFSISSNEGWTAANSDVLSGERRFDEVVFSGS
jgi:hypothetical protein